MNEKLDKLVKDGVVASYSLDGNKAVLYFPKGQVLTISNETTDSLHYKSNLVIEWELK